MTFGKITIFALYMLISTLTCVGQRPPLKYGKVDDKETALTSYQGADAVILCDYGEYKFNGITGVVFFEFTHHLRIKILTEAGLRYATQQIHYYDLRSASYYPYNETYILRAQTLNVDEKGKITDSKVKAKSTVVSQPDDNFNASVTIHFPDVKVGSIIEYEITIPTLETVNPNPWMVQYDLPCLWNELRIITPLEFNYAIKPYNIDYADVSDVKSITTSIKYPGRSVVYNATLFQFLRQDVPALPYLGSDLEYNNSRMFVRFILDYVSKKFILPQMSEILKAMEPEYKFMDKSEKQLILENSGFILYKRPDLVKIAKELNKSRQFGVPLVLNMGLNDTIKKLSSNSNTNEEKVMAIYQYVQDQAVWNNQYRIFVDAGIPLFFIKLADKFAKEPAKMNTSLHKVIQKQEGTSSEINAILINLLRAGGFKANPVLVSTLNTGYLDTTFFNLQQFNHLIAAVEVDGEVLLLDAVKKGGGSIMSSDIMNEYGLMIEARNARWIRVAYPYAILPVDMEAPVFEQNQ
ncbi:MAG: DUF3857 domain-containing protein [Bacteroidales bacterium]|nr:DUF3857 domain-containing protein [Bacteroidales bacterium]